MTEFLFAVGPFAKGHSHHALISPFIKSEHRVRLVGQLYKLQVGYPVLSLEGEQEIEGILFELETSDSLSALLDQFHMVHSADPEKGLHFKKTVKFQIGVQNVEARVYDLNMLKLPKTAQKMENIQWEQELQVNPPLPLKLTEQQKTYIKRLGQSSSREIIPIDLPLYRELMKLEMIVDKGRRLALSPLGKETFRYL